MPSKPRVRRTPWHRADIVAALRKQGSSLAAVGRDLGLARQTMYWALIKPHPRANEAIAHAIGKSMHVLWPNWFDENGLLVMAPPAPRKRPRISAPAERESRVCVPASPRKTA